MIFKSSQSFQLNLNYFFLNHIYRNNLIVLC